MSVASTVRLVALATLAVLASACGGSGSESGSGRGAPDAIALAGRVFGTSWSVKLFGPDLEKLAPGAIEDGIEAALDRVDRGMSTWRDDSELSRFNAAPAGEWFDVSFATAEVVRTALEIAEATDGAFDPTVLPLVRLFGFGSAGRGPAGEAASDSEPSEEAVAAARRVVGFHKVEVRFEPPGLRKSVDGVELDLSGIAKGYAVDEVARAVVGLGAESLFVEIGGETRVRGRKPGGDPWRIGIERPLVGRREPGRILELTDGAIATSGDYRNFVERDGVRYSHTFDPRTGRPAMHKLASVTVLASDCMRADALATALMVLGPEAGYDKAKELNLEALFVERIGSDEFVENPTEPFAMRFLETAGADPR